MVESKSQLLLPFSNTMSYLLDQCDPQLSAQPVLMLISWSPQQMTDSIPFIPRTMDLLSPAAAHLTSHLSESWIFQGMLLLISLRVTPSTDLASLLQFLQLADCSCFLFNDCLRTHMKYFGSANSSGNSKVKPWMSYSWPRLCTAQRDSDDFPNPLHTPSSDPALPVQHYVNKYTSHILPLKKKMYN